MEKGLFIFRRDLRIYDNTGLYKITELCNEVNCIFILDPNQIDSKKNNFFSAPAALFMIDSLLELQKNIPLTILLGDPIKIITSLKNYYDIIAFNEDYTKYAVERDSALRHLGVISYQDVCINSPLDIKPYKVFTPYYNIAKKIKIKQLVKPDIKKIKKISQSILISKPLNIQNLREWRYKIINLIPISINIMLLQKGGRSNAIECLKQFVKDSCNKYQTKRDNMSFETSRLSPHLKFGTISPREVYYACSNSIFRKQLYWRDFYMQIGYHFPNVYGSNFKNKINWENDKTLFKAWCEGKTGYDIVDACMTQLNKSGYMHNRGRMIVASFLTKLLHIDWRWGEKYFASRLVDYDPANNNGGWQWSAGTGVDAQPYFRIFNPVIQAIEHDADETYRIKWLGETYKSKYNNISKIIDYTKERQRALKLISK